MFRLAAMAGLTVQFPRMLCSTAAAAPGWPSMAEYCAVWANRPKRKTGTMTPSRIASGIRKLNPVSTATTMSTTRMTTPLPMTIGSARGLALCTSPATMRICAIRPGVASPSSFFFAMTRRIWVPSVESETAWVLSRRVKATSPAGRETRAPRCPSAVHPGRWPGLAGSDGLPGLRGLAVKLARAVGGADQRAGHDAGEADLQGLFAEFDELLGLDPALDRVVPRRRAQVLGDRQQVAAGRVQVGQGLADLVPLLAQAEDQVGLRDQAVRPGPGQHAERALVAEPRPDPAEQPRHGLDVVRQHLGPGAEHLGQPVRFGVEVRDQQFDAAAGHGRVDLPGGLR